MTLIMKATELSGQSAAFRKSYPTVKALADGGWWMQPKYDGCFGMAVMRHDGESRMLSRTGEDYSVSCQHILDHLVRLMDALRPGWNECVILGEVWHRSWEFSKISGSMRRRASCPELVFMAHDLLPLTLETATPYSSRAMQLRGAIGDGSLLSGNPVCLVASRMCSELEDPQVYAGVLKASGPLGNGHFDGVIMKDPHAGYRIGPCRDGQLVKVKPTASLDLKVMAWTRSRGEKTGRDVYTIEVEHNGVRTEVGSGIPHDYIPGVGQIVEIEFMDITKDGRLREPRFKGVRFDKEQADA